MTDIKDKLVRMIKNQDISSIELMANSLGIPEAQVQDLLIELTEEKRLNGYLTPDGRRYFSRDVKPSQKPAVHKEGKQPRFLEYDTRPGRIVAVIGLILVAAAIVFLFQAGGDLVRENFGTALLLIGLLIMMGGCYQIGRRPTP
ncbi:hypothetical protein EU537_08345 [Candidatus Thorarchaeota archaeon]|nr:MAG: hypothetical protein EU537_08345 [Candidatus Thorarchaeota archaeon]